VVVDVLVVGGFDTVLGLLVVGGGTVGLVVGGGG